MNLLDTLWRGGHLRTLDHALAQSLRRLDPATDDAVLAAAALASLAVGHGHAGIDIVAPQRLLDAAIDWPAAADWQQALAASRWVATPAADADAPLALEHGVLYLRRYREYEQRLAANLQRLVAQPPPPADLAVLAPLFATLFPDAHTGDDHQARAAALAQLRSLLLVTGGPGTGKTRTIARLLLLLVAGARHAGRPDPRITLAAPTGRAAERMAESLRAAAAELHALPAVDPALCEALPDAASTLHRLLGPLPDSPRFRFDAEHRLPHDVVVVDEASMVDLPLMCKLVEAVADGARLILLGDPDQLPSVEAGDVLAAICQAAAVDTALPEAIAPLLGPVGGASAPTRTIGDSGDLFAQADSADDEPGSPLHGHRVHLQRGYRQADGFDLAPLATAVRDGDADAALALLRAEPPDASIRFHENVLDPLAGPMRDTLLGHWQALADAPDPAAALAQAAQLRLLTALRDGPQGARGLNARIEQALTGARGERPQSHFHGRLLLVTQNHHRLQLFNGDVGICLRDGRGALVAWFPGGDGVRGFHPAALPAHEAAFAMTVHKAQGSEFDTVWLQLPRGDSRVLSRELLYTALTRARRQLHLAAGEDVLRAALTRHAARVSGLAWRLRQARA